jgi:hypothetical protein
MLFTRLISKKSLILISLFILHGKYANSEVILKEFKNNKVTVEISNTINPGDDEDFEKILKFIKENNKELIANSVQFNSSGGSINTAIKVGEIIRKNELNTYLGRKKICSSACVLSFCGGVERLSLGSMYIHRPSFDSSTASENISQKIRETDWQLRSFLANMDVSLQYLEVQDSVPFWKYRLIREQEKYEWRITGTDRTFEEIKLNQFSNSYKISRNKVHELVLKFEKHCYYDFSRFKKSFWACEESKINSALKIPIE